MSEKITTVTYIDKPIRSIKLSNYVDYLKERVELQNTNRYNYTYLLINDLDPIFLESIRDKPQSLKSTIIDICKNYLSVGINPDQATICLQSQIPELLELTYLIKSIVNINNMIVVDTIAGITAFNTTTVAINESQVGLINNVYSYINKINNIYGNIINKPTIQLFNYELSDGNIDITLDTDTIYQKIDTMFSEQMVWQFFKLVTDDTDKVETLHTRYREGHIGYIMVKRLLTDAIVEKF